MRMLSRHSGRVRTANGSVISRRRLCASSSAARHRHRRRGAGAGEILGASFLFFVMPGLDPGIHVDRRVKPGDDDRGGSGSRDRCADPSRSNSSRRPAERDRRSPPPRPPAWIARAALSLRVWRRARMAVGWVGSVSGCPSQPPHVQPLRSRATRTVKDETIKKDETTNA
jgi:hypothetical protein